MSSQDVINATSLEMRYPGCDALQGIDLNVKSGTVFALLGENGAGKTTMIRILTGFKSRLLVNAVSVVSIRCAMRWRFVGVSAMYPMHPLCMTG